MVEIKTWEQLDRLAYKMTTKEWEENKRRRWVSLDELKKAFNELIKNTFDNPRNHFYCLKQDFMEWRQQFFLSPACSTDASESKPEVDTKCKLQQEGSNKTSREVLSCRATPDKAEVCCSGNKQQSPSNEVAFDKASTLPKNKEMPIEDLLVDSGLTGHKPRGIFAKKNGKVRR